MEDIERIQKKLIKRNGLAQQKTKKKKIDRIVKAVLFYWIIFVVVAWVTFWVKDSVPDTLITMGLGGGSVELIITGLIEIARDRIHKKDDE